jgi:hypothetical protein
MIDLTTFKPVTAGTCLLNYKGQPILPPNPTLAVAPTVAKIGQSVSLSDAPGATTFWWLGTLVSLYASLGGGSGESSVPVIVKLNGRKAITSGAVTPASYSNAVFTPPKLSGSFVAKGRARTKVQVVLSATLLGLSVSNTATTTMKVTR